MQLSSLLTEKTVRRALEEDLGHGFDVTADAIITEATEAKASIIAREDGILAGLIPCLSAFMLIDSDLDIEMHAQDGTYLEAGQTIAIISGPARAILTAERTALNFLIHLSGIATLTNQYVQAVEETSAIITCTRKTLPGLRAFQKYAVYIGGGKNHRFGLDDAILIKDNHVAIAGGVKPALDLARQRAGHMVKIEIEVDTLDQFKEVLGHGGADITMLDNFTPEQLQKAAALNNGKMILEASGGVNLATVRDIAETGVDYISVGALTHSAQALDIGLDIDIEQ